MRGAVGVSHMTAVFRTGYLNLAEGEILVTEVMGAAEEQ